LGGELAENLPLGVSRKVKREPFLLFELLVIGIVVMASPKVAATFSYPCQGRGRCKP
jgi:hypothetical protein